MAPRTMFTDTETGESRVPFRILRFNLRTVIIPRDNSTVPLDPASHKSRLHTLHARPFNHLSVWAYLAFAFIVLAVTTVIAYAIYSCYHSSRKKMEAGMSLPPIPVGRDRVTWQDLETSDTLVKVDDGTVGSGEKARKNGPDMARTGGLHKSMKPESETNMFSLPSNSLSSMSNVNDTSFELVNHYLTTLPLAHTSDKAATYIPFHLPPPPPSSTPAHKEHLERQYRGRLQHSPVSPSPSFPHVTSFPQITPRNAQVSGEGSSKSCWSGKTVTEGDQSRGRPSDQLFEDHAIQFDSNNIRFAPPRDPFMAPSSAPLWNDPKLSPIQGSIISNANTSGSSSAGESSLSQAVMAASHSPPPVSLRKRSKSVLGYDARRRGEDKENVDPSLFDMPYGRNIA